MPPYFVLFVPSAYKPQVSTLENTVKSRFGKIFAAIDFEELRGLEGVRSATIDVDGLKLNIGIAHGLHNARKLLEDIKAGKYPISVCLGTACYVRGAEKVLDAFKKELNLEVGQTTPDGKFSLTCLRCVGACGLAPVAMGGDKVYGRLTPADIKGIVDEYRNME